MTNPFLALADAQIVRPVKAQALRATLRLERRNSAAEKELAEDRQLTAAYHKYKREQRQAILDGPYGEPVRALVAFMRGMGLSDADALLERVSGRPWVEAMSIDERFVLLGMIGDRIVKVRERNGLAPFDDALPGEPAKIFELIKAELRVR